MINATLQSYAPGGRIFVQLAKQYGKDAAMVVYQAALTGDEGNEINTALTKIKFGQSLDGSTASNFVKQITTDPLAAPLESANNQIGNAFLAFLKSPWVLLLVGLWLFFQFGGAQWVQRKVFK